MEAAASSSTPSPNIEHLKQTLIKKGITPTPKILHTLHKKQIQKLNRSHTKHPLNHPPQEPQEDSYFNSIKSEYKKLNRELSKTNAKANKFVGNPWEKLKMLEHQDYGVGDVGNGKLRVGYLKELSDVIEKDRDQFKWLLLNDDVEVEEDEVGKKEWTPPKPRGEVEAIKFLVEKYGVKDLMSFCIIGYDDYIEFSLRLSGMKLSVKDWRFSRMMRQSGLPFTEKQMLRIVEGLGEKGQWENAKSVVEFFFNSKEHKHFRSRYVYTKLLAVLGRARRPYEALEVFNRMQRDFYIYPDMAAYHSIAVTLGQAGLLKELVNVIDRMKENPPKLRRKNWDPVRQPDVVIFNAVLNACVPNKQWKGVSWVFQELRKSDLRPNGATYGLAMEVMLESGKYELVHSYFEKMKRSGETLTALTYRVLVKALWKEGKVCEAVNAVRDMEQRGVVASSFVYYELACCLCYHGRWQEGFMEIDKAMTLRQTKPLQVTFTGLISSSLKGGHIDDCAAIYETSKSYCTPDIGMVNAMLKAYGQNDMFLEAKELFEAVKGETAGSKTYPSDNIQPDAYTFLSMLQTSVASYQWEYFEYVYKEMSLSGYQFDSNKHASLLIKASRAGKWWLLEHAFDTILEAGEIPHMSFFIEMLCQAVIRRAFDKAITISNTMAHAPFQVSEQQWIKMFEENEDRISRVSLVDLLDALLNNNPSTEATVKNLIAALQSICVSMDVKDTGPIRALTNRNSSGVIAADCNKGSDVHAIEITNSTSLATPIPRPYRNTDVQDKDEDSDWEMVPDILETSNCMEGGKSVNNALKHFSNDLLSNDADHCYDDEDHEGDEPFDFDALGLGKFDSEADKPSKSDAPTASDILETWKKSRKNDAYSYPFSRGQNTKKLTLRDC